MTSTTLMSGAYSAEAAARRKALAWLAALVLGLGFLMPVISYGRLSFVNIEMLSEKTASPMLKFLAAYPALAGLALFALLFGTTELNRGIGLSVIGVLPLLVLLADRSIGTFYGDTVGSGGSILGSSALCGLLGCTGLFAGLRTMHYRARFRAGPAIGTIGGVLYVVSLVIPMGAAGSSTTSLAMPFELMKQDGMRIVGAGYIVQMLLMVAASVVCVVALAGFDPRKTRSRGDLAFAMFIVSVAIWLAAPVVAGFAAPAALPMRQRIVPMMLVARILVWFAAILCLLPFGLADLSVTLCERRNQGPITVEP